MASGNPALVKLAHELAGAIALEQKDYDTALAELERAIPRIPTRFTDSAAPSRGRATLQRPPISAEKRPTSTRCPS